MGLPVETGSRKAAWSGRKDQIEGYGLEPFIDKCKESVWKYKGMWRISPARLDSGQIWSILM